MDRKHWFIVFLICAVLLPCHSMPIIPRQETGNVIELSTDVDSIKTLFADGDDVEVFNNETILLYKSDAVYQINVPQKAVEGLEVTVSIESPLKVVKSLESLVKERITLREFSEMTGIHQNADLVFEDWDINDDGFLDRYELSQEEVKELDV